MISMRVYAYRFRFDLASFLYSLLFITNVFRQNWQLTVDISKGMRKKLSFLLNCKSVTFSFHLPKWGRKEKEKKSCFKLCLTELNPLRGPSMHISLI